MDLAELKFVVDTKQLDEAAKKIDALAASVSKVNKPVTDAAMKTEKLALAQASVAEKAAKAALAQLKLEQAQGKVNTTTAKSISVLERQNLILEYMAQGNSKGQASILATAKAAGALDDEMLALNKTLVTQRTLIGGDPFDKSIGLMQKLQNEYKTTTEVTTLFNRNLGLTQKQMTDLAREKERLVALYGIEGKSLNSLSAEYEQLIQKSVKINQANDARTNSMKAQIKAQNDTAKANDYISQELERVNRLTESGGNVTSATNNKLIKFEQALKASGVTAAEQVTKLEAYRQKLLSIQKASGDRQVDYLSRALGPQITDIAVGLATGQAPLTILLQQGGQLRDQFALAGVAGADMGRMLVQASKAMVSSIKDIGLAVGQLVTGAIAGTGRAIFDGIVAPFKRLSEARDALKQLDEGIISNLRYARLMEVANGRMIQSVISFGKVAAVTGVIALGMFAKGLFDVIKEQDALTTQLVLTGASLGVNTTTAISYANALNSVGVTTASALKVMQAMAKEGGFVASEINMVVTSANNLKLAGVAIEDVVKQFAKLKEKPVEALIEIAKNTGLVRPEIIALVSELEQQGKTSEAAAIAMKAYADVTITQKDRLKNELSDFAIFIKTLSSNVGEFFDEVFRGLFRKASPTEALKRQIADLENTIKLGTQASPDTKAKNDATLTALKEQLQLSQRVADAQSTADNDNIRAAKALGEWQKLSVTNLDKEKKAELDIANIRRVGLEAKKSEAEIEKLIANYREKNKAPKTDAEKEQLRLLKESEKYLSRISSLNNESIKEQENYTKAQKLALDIFSDPDFKNYPESQRIKIANSIEQAHAEELIANELTKQRAIQKEIYDDYIKLQAERDKAMFDAEDKAVALNKALTEESNELALQASLIGKTDAQRKLAVKTRQAEVILAKELADIDKLKSLNNGQDIKDLRVQAYQRFADRTKNINTEIANDFAIEMKKQYDIISNGLSDAVMTGLFEGGKSGRKKLRDLIVAELKKPIKIVIDTVINATLGSFINSIIGSAGGSAAGSFAGSAAGSAATGGISGMMVGGATLGAQAGAFGQGIASSFSLGAPVSSMGTATSASFNAGATYGGPVLGALGGMAINRGISNGYKVNDTMSTIQDIGTVIAAAINPVFGVVAGAVSGIVNRAFGRKLTDVGVRGTLGGETGFEGERYTFEKGGWFRSDKTRTSSLDEADRSAIASSFRLIKTSVMGLAETAGFGSDAIKNFTTSFQVNLKDLSPEEAVKKYQEEFAKVEEAMAAVVIGSSGYRRENETNLQTLTRLSTFMGGINSAFEKLGFETYRLELSSIDAAQSFVDLFGGIEGFNKATTFFYENFFSVEEKMANLTTDLTTEFDKLGLALPTTREAFRALVTAAKEAGNDTQVKNLLDLQYAFAELVPVTEEVISTVDILTETMKGLLKERASLEVELLQLQGRTTEANTALRNIATEGFTEAEIAAYDYNQTLRTQIESLKAVEVAAAAYAEKVKALVDEQTNLNIELLKVQGRTSEANSALRALAIEGLEETEIAAYDYNQTLRDQIELTQKLNEFAKEKSELEVELLRAQGRTAEAEAAAYALATAGMQQAEIAAYDYNQSLKAQIQSYADLKTTTDSTFESLKSSIESSIAELEKSFSATDTALSNVEKAISAERELAQVRLDSAVKEEQAIKNVFDVLKKSISEIRGQTIGGAISSKGLIADAIKSGRIPDAGALSDAISDVKTSIDGTAYVSMVDQKRASLLFANQLEDLQKIVEPQLSSAEQAVILAQESVIVLDANLKAAQEQVSILRGIDVNILSMSQALTALNSAISTETGARTQIGNLNTELETATGQYNTLRNVDTSIVPLVTALLNFQSAIANETDNIVSPSVILPTASLNVASDYSARQGVAVTQSTNSNTVLELQALRAELTLLRSEAVATALNTGKTSRILDRATQENGAILVVSAA